MTTIPPTRKAPCRAKDPRTCPYHGAVIRMEDAAAKGDLDAYFIERKKVEEAEAANWVDDNPRFSVQEKQDITITDVRNAVKEFQKKYDELFSNNYARNIYGSTDMDGLGRTLVDRVNNSYMPNPEKIRLPKLGELTIIDSKVEGVVDGEDTWIVFEVGGHYYRLSGTYSSWDSHSWYNLDEVEPETKLNTTIERGYRVI